MNFEDWVEWQAGRKPWSEASDSKAVFALGLAGETGEVVEHFKKYLRDGTPILFNDELALELGDVLFYWLKLVRFTGFTVEEILAMNQEKLIRRDKERGK